MAKPSIPAQITIIPKAEREQIRFGGLFGSQLMAIAIGLGIALVCLADEPLPSPADEPPVVEIAPLHPPTVQLAQPGVAHPAETGATAEGAERISTPRAVHQLWDDGLHSIREISVDIRNHPGELPDDIACRRFASLGKEVHGPGTSRPWMMYQFCWESPAVCHAPLYFEDVNLERYGYTRPWIQPVLSGAHFFATIPALPYLVASHERGECVYTLGHYRPGSLVPYQYQRPPLSLRGGVAEAAVVTGLIFALP